MQGASVSRSKARLVPRLSGTSLPWPVDWATLYEQTETRAARPLILEIGFGYGHFLRHLSATFPDAMIVGVEIANECLEHIDRQLDRGEMTNVRAVFARAETALHHLFEPASIDQIHVNFPDPWFKSRHERRRLMQRTHIDAMVSRLKAGGQLFLATDIREYAEMSDEALRETAGLSNTLDRPWSTEPLPGRVVTKYERKALTAGRPCHYFAYRRNDTPVPFIPVLTEAEMPHLTLALPLLVTDIVEQFEPFEAKAAAREPAHAETNISVNASQAFGSRQAALIEAYVVEPTIQQHVGIIVAPIRERPGEYTVGLSTIGSPRPTDGLHFAVRKVADWLLTLHAEARITGDKARSGYAEV